MTVMLLMRAEAGHCTVPCTDYYSQGLRQLPLGFVTHQDTALRGASLARAASLLRREVFLSWSLSASTSLFTPIGQAPGPRPVVAELRASVACRCPWRECGQGLRVHFPRCILPEGSGGTCNGLSTGRYPPNRDPGMAQGFIFTSVVDSGLPIR